MEHFTASLNNSPVVLWAPSPTLSYRPDNTLLQVCEKLNLVFIETVPPSLESSPLSSPSLTPRTVLKLTPSPIEDFSDDDDFVKPSSCFTYPGLSLHILHSKLRLHDLRSFTHIAKFSSRCDEAYFQGPHTLVARDSQDKIVRLWDCRQLNRPLSIS